MTNETIIVREVCNGVMFLSALMIIGIFMHYMWKRRREKFDTNLQAALAITIVLLGNSFRAGSSWMEFLWVQLNWNSGFLRETIEFFITATVLIVLGKVMMINTFAPDQYRKTLTILALIISFGVPMLVAFIASQQ
jgi:uncharacterized membrane protein